MNFVVKLTQLPLPYPHYACIYKRIKTVNVTLKRRTQEPFSTSPLMLREFKIYGKGK
uniref:transposase n=1 Tax=Candidatus Enterovibrio altilux TaxID=1927128 RepID=UPI001F184B8E|nr:transposase [Candidatus Enterovibrio luxaltus]